MTHEPTVAPCPECGAPALAIAEAHLDRSPGYQYVRPPTIAKLQEEIWAYTVEKGWADDEEMGRTIGDLFMLMVSEVAEAYEEHRKWRAPTDVWVQAGKPEGIPIELADVVIRIMSFCGKHGIDLQDAVLRKMAYNETRPHRHGGKRA